MLKQLIDVCVSRRLAVDRVHARHRGLRLHARTPDTPIEAFPDVTNYQVNVITKAPGLAPEEVEKQITLPLERALNGTPGMISMRSREPVRPVADLPDVRRRRRRVQGAHAASPSASPSRSDLPAGRHAGARARVHAARRDLPVPADERSPLAPRAALRAGVDGRRPSSARCPASPTSSGSAASCPRSTSRSIRRGCARTG